MRQLTPPPIRAMSVVIASILLTHTAGAQETLHAPAAPGGQLGAPLEWIDVPGAEDRKYLIQRTRDGRLILTPNEAFFPTLGLRAAGTGDVPDQERLNGGKTFRTIERWDAGDTAEWGVLCSAPGAVTIRLAMTAPTNDGRFTVTMGDNTFAFPTVTAKAEPVIVGTHTFDLTDAGRHVLRLTCDLAADKTALHWIELSGPAVQQGAVLRKRWRPAAAHTRFSSAAVTEHHETDTPGSDVRLWVMEMDAVPGPLGFYSPITTPFGYYGPSWQADGTVNAGFNFSLWSYKRGQPEPPVAQLSHLLAVGHPQASFGGFGHEGTGVKVRDWNPLTGRQGQRQALALRVEPGAVYDTYYSYFYATDEQRWRLFGIGNKYNRGRPLEQLWAGSFVEVPGPPPVQRTGPYVRTMRYRGWVREDNGTWHPLDRMTTGNVNRDTGLTHTDRGVTDDGWFYLQTGGWEFRTPAGGRFVELAAERRFDPPEYLDPARTAALLTVPCDVEISTAERDGRTIRGRLSVRHPGPDARLTVYWGAQDALTFADRWAHSVTLDATPPDANTFVIENTPSEQPIFLRVLLENADGRFWSRITRTVE